VAHQTRDLAHTALLVYHALKRGDIPINGSTGAVLGRSLAVLRDLAEASLAAVRVAGQHHRPVRLTVTPFLNDLAAAAALHAESRKLGFTLEPGVPRWAVVADPQVLGSAVMNLLNSAFPWRALEASESATLACVDLVQCSTAARADRRHSGRRVRSSTMSKPRWPDSTNSVSEDPVRFKRGIAGFFR
jgi:hypothetical protein